MAAIAVENLAKTYDGTRALDGVSFEVARGECMALLGPNGAGKSTLIEILATLTKPTDGVAFVEGARVDEDPGRVRRALGLAFQEPLTSKHLTAREVLIHHARLYNVPTETARDRAGDLLAFVDLTDRAEDRVTTFSGGMKRRLDLARALMTEPDVLVLDEPASGLDPRARRTVRDRVRTLVDEGTTVLLATHEMEEAQALADRVAILDRGRLEALGTPAELTDEMGRRVVEVELARGQDAQPVLDLAAELGIEDAKASAGTAELVLAETDRSPGEIVDALEDAGLDYEEVRVREPDLADVFLETTGHRLEEGSQ